jgi:uncharacterized repeat protein (TIGR01451 family)
LNLQVQNETCTYANGSVYAAVSGGVPPYAYLWGGGETTESISGLSVGTYTVTVTDFVGTQVSDQATVTSENYAPILSFTHSYCPGENYHVDFQPTPPAGLAGDFGPYTFSQGVFGQYEMPFSPGNYISYLDIGSAPSGSEFNITYWDANGCPGELSGTVGDPATSWPIVGVLSVEGSCANQPTGSIVFNWSGVGPWDSYPILRQPGAGAFDINNQWNNIDLTAGRFSNLAAGDYWLMFSLAITPALVQGGSICASDSVLVTVPDLGSTCGIITGSTYVDYNSDCIDAEPNASNVVVEIQPGPIYTTSSGVYSVVVPNGSYTMTTSASAITQSCPASATVNGNVVGASIGHQPTIPLDVAIGLGSGPARPGFQLHYSMIVQNLSSSASGATTTTFTFDPAVSFISAWPSGSVAGNTITWNQPSLAIFQEREYQIQLQVPPDVGLIGTDLLASATVSTANTDGDLSNNNANAAITVTGSYDPNDKTAYTSTRASGSLYFINEDDWIDYVIRFQNTGTDTAFNIVVTDTLPSTLDPATISLASASHIHTWMVQGQGTLKFIFPNILLPDSNVNEAASHGLIRFRIRPRQPLLPGTVIENTANIYFDFNPPVITEPSVLIAEFSTGQEQGQEQEHLILVPNPAHDRVRLVLPQEITGPTLVEVLSLDGRTAMIVRPEKDAEFSVLGLAPGSYLLRVRGTQGTGVVRFVKY